MKFETADTTPFELEIQIAVENASIEKKALNQVIKELNPQTKEYKKAMEMLNKEQQKEWRMLSHEMENQQGDILTESSAKISSVRKKLEALSRVIRQQAAKRAETQQAKPARPKRPGR